MQTAAFRTLAVLGWLWFAATPTPATIILETVLVGDVDNIADTTVMQDGSSGYGSVSYAYRIGTNEVTNGQYMEFLNAVDPSGANLHALWNSGMTDNVNGGVLFNVGAANGVKYSLKPGYGNRPVISVDFFDAMRFANWLNNGQGSGDTETGAYTLSLGGLAPRNAGVTVWIPSEDEWYKAAFYDPTPGAGGGDNWWLYPTRSNLTPTSIDPNGSDPNSANYARGFTTDVGGYTLAKSYYGTFDQGGDVWEWNEAIGIGSTRGFRGGAWSTSEAGLRASTRLANGPTYSNSDVGFRVATTPEPCAAAGLVFGMALLTTSRRKRFQSRSAL